MTGKHSSKWLGRFNNKPPGKHTLKPCFVRP